MTLCPDAAEEPSEGWQRAENKGGIAERIPTRMLNNTIRCDTLRYRTLREWRATVDEDGHYVLAIAL